ncbi:MAG: hypothetical protein RBU23_12945 [Candidatus Auribacterota bacterium]|jgi:hypothetical protein|nr:hypothetical protein [Candidatus Auribacterota bacterium]
MLGTVVNSEEYSWKDAQVILLGKVIEGITAFKYKKSQDKELRYGRGNEPIGFKRGNKKYEGSITVLKSELEALKSASPDGDIMSLKGFDIVFSYLAEDGTLKTDIAKFAEFTESEEALKQGDGNGEYELPFIALRIKAA